MTLRSSGADGGIDAEQQHVTRTMLLAAKQTAPQGHEWTAGSGAETLRMKPFLDIADEPYTTYLKVANS